MITLVQGTDWYFDILIQSVNPTTNEKTPINITGWTIKYGIAASEADSAIFINNTTIHTDAVNGMSQIHIIPTDQGGITSGSYVQEIIGVKGDGVKIPLVTREYVEVINSLVF